MGNSILVVEDEEPILNLVVAYLEKDGFHVATATNGESALAYARTHRPDLVMLDLLLPGIDGLKGCRRLALLVVATVPAVGEQAELHSELPIG